MKDFSFNSEGSGQLNFDVMRDNLLEELQNPLDTPGTIPVTYSLYTRPETKMYKLVYSKRVLDKKTFKTYAFGYTSEEDDEEMSTEDDARENLSESSQPFQWSADSVNTLLMEL